MHTSNTKWTHQVLFIYLCILYVTIKVKTKGHDLRGNKAEDGWREEEEGSLMQLYFK